MVTAITAFIGLAIGFIATFVPQVAANTIFYVCDIIIKAMEQLTPEMIINAFDEIEMVGSFTLNDAIVDLAMFLVIALALFSLINVVVSPMVNNGATQSPFNIIVRTFTAIVLLSNGAWLTFTFAKGIWSIFAEFHVNLLANLGDLAGSLGGQYEVLLEAFEAHAAAGPEMNMELIGDALTPLGGIEGMLAKIGAGILVTIVLWNFFELILEMVQRIAITILYVWLSPLAVATIATPSTAGIAGKWLHALIAQCILMALNGWTVAIGAKSIEVMYNLKVVGGASEGINFLMGAFLAYGVLKALQQLDDVFRNVGANVVRQNASLVKDAFAVKNIMGAWGNHIGSNLERAGNGSLKNQFAMARGGDAGFLKGPNNKDVEAFKNKQDANKAGGVGTTKPNSATKNGGIAGVAATKPQTGLQVAKNAAGNILKATTLGSLAYAGARAAGSAAGKVDGMKAAKTQANRQKAASASYKAMKSQSALANSSAGTAESAKKVGQAVNNPITSENAEALSKAVGKAEENGMFSEAQAKDFSENLDRNVANAKAELNDAAIAKDEAKQQLDEAKTALQAADINGGDTTAASNALKEAESNFKQKEEAYKAAEDKLKAAQTNSENVFKNVQNAANALENAKTPEEKAAAMQEFQKASAAAAEISMSGAERSFNELQSAAATYESVSNNAASSQGEIDAARDNLQSAASAFVDSASESSIADAPEMQSVIGAAQSIADASADDIKSATEAFATQSANVESKDFSPVGTSPAQSGYDGLQSAIANYNSVLSNPQATQSDITSAQAALRDSATNFAQTLNESGIQSVDKYKDMANTVNQISAATDVDSAKAAIANFTEQSADMNSTDFASGAAATNFFESIADRQSGISENATEAFHNSMQEFAANGGTEHDAVRQQIASDFGHPDATDCIVTPNSFNGGTLSYDVAIRDVGQDEYGNTKITDTTYSGVSGDSHGVFKDSIEMTQYSNGQVKIAAEYGNGSPVSVERTSSSTGFVQTESGQNGEHGIGHQTEFVFSDTGNRDEYGNQIFTMQNTIDKSVGELHVKQGVDVATAAYELTSGNTQNIVKVENHGRDNSGVAVYLQMVQENKSQGGPKRDAGRNDSHHVASSSNRSSSYYGGQSERQPTPNSGKQRREPKTIYNTATGRNVDSKTKKAVKDAQQNNK